jgi:hypothetical protein
VAGEWKYTKKGIAYFNKNAHFEYVVKVPIKIVTREGRQAGRVRYDLMPYSKMSGSWVFQSQVGRLIIARSMPSLLTHALEQLQTRLF